MRGFSFLHHTFVAGAFIALAPPSVVAAQSSEEVLAPSSSWQLDASETRCRLARQFGNAPNTHLLIMETDEPTASVSLVLAGPAVEDVLWHESLKVQFGQLEPTEVEEALKGVFGDHGSGLMANGIRLDDASPEVTSEDEQASTQNGTVESPNGLPEIPSERFADVAALRISQGNAVLVALEMGGLEKALGALNDCSQNFIAYWGLDLEKHKSMRQGPRWINMEDIAGSVAAKYPRNALRRHEQGVVRFLLFVDEQGHVSECRHSDATKLRALNSPICKELQRAQFQPALDADGNPMASYFAGRVRYRLGD